jgi:hypothetical protein
MIEKGRLSATRDEGGRYLVDPAELERVFGTLRNPDADRGARTEAMHENALAHNALARELEVVRELLASERTMHERERCTWEEERTFLRGLVEKQTDQLKLLTDERDTSRSSFWWWRRRRRS